MTTQLLPNNDPDLQLARRIGSYLEGHRIDFRDTGDAFSELLLQYKNQRSQQLPATNSNAIWEGISRETQPRKNTAKVYQLGRSKTRAIWATAASVLIAAFIGIYYFLIQQPQLIASSEQMIETVVLDDGSKITLRPYSSFYALSGNAEEHNYKLEGEAWFVVTSRPDRIFSVKAGNGKVSVLGTKFDLSNWGGKTQVYLEEGSIRFKNLNTKTSVTLNPGESAEIKADSLIETSSAAPTEFTDWMNRELIFRNRTARYVFNELEQEFNITITVPEFIKNTSLSGGLSLESVDQSLQDLALVLDGEFIKVNKNTYKFVPNR